VHAEPQVNTAVIKVTTLNNEFGWKKRIVAAWGGGGGGDFEYTLI
jgi:hypothetical protein